MKLKTLALAALALALVPAVAGAAGTGYRFELTPRIGYNFGGTLDGQDTFQFNTDLEAKDSPSYGVSFDIPLSRNLQIELLASRQSTELRFDEGLFGPNLAVADFDVSYYHVGLLWQGHSGRVSPFFVASLGVGELDPKIAGASSETRLSTSLGGGVKVFFDDQEHVGLRLEGRGFWTDLSDDNHWHNDNHDWWDDDYTYGNDFTQGQVSAGLIIAW